ncbi:MAG: hypothetical protein ABSE06_14135 [Anaerolineaceae bacterium]
MILGYQLKGCYGHTVKRKSSRDQTRQRQAEQRGRITRPQADEILQALVGPEIEIHPQEWGELLPLARRFVLCSLPGPSRENRGGVGSPGISACMKASGREMQKQAYRE